MGEWSRVCAEAARSGLVAYRSKTFSSCVSSRFRSSTCSCSCRLCVATVPLILNSTLGLMFVSGSLVGLRGARFASPRGSYLRDHVENNT